jgi:hypothetical protein
MQRLNVAITRAKFAVWIIGCREVLEKDDEWRQLITYCHNSGGIYTPPGDSAANRGGVSKNRGIDKYSPRVGVSSSSDRRLPRDYSKDSYHNRVDSYNI